MNRRRTIAFGAIACAIVALPLAAEQFLASIALRDRATPLAWPALVPAAQAERIDRGAAAERGAPVVRLVLARRALAQRRNALAKALVDRLPPSADRSALEGVLAERRGDPERAIAAYLAARDVDDVERVVAGLQRRGDFDEALRQQRALIGALQADAEHTGALPEAYYRLGMLEREALRSAHGAERAKGERRVLLDLGRAIELAPLADRYWIAAGRQALELGEVSAAGAFFQKALELNARSGDAKAGLAAVAARTRPAAPQ